MKKKISPNDCNEMFEDRLKILTMKEIGVELKHFEIGTAPEFPSYLVNQDILKNKLIKKFSDFFDSSKSSSMEIIYLKSNYGNGKSHFLKTIYSFLCNFENVIVKQVAIKKEEIDLKLIILKGIGRKLIKEMIDFFVVPAFKDKSKILTMEKLKEDLDISLKLSLLLCEAVEAIEEKNLEKQAKIIAILSGDYLDSYLNDFEIKKEELGDGFYFEVIRLICEYLEKKENYFILTLDEYEHIYSWRNKELINSFFKDIKYFTDHLGIYKNLFFILAESETKETEINRNNLDRIIDPAYNSRKSIMTYQIDKINSEEDIKNLFNMIKDRYEKYYEIKLDDYVNEILTKIFVDENIKKNPNYRNYSQAIIKILEDYKEILQTNKKVEIDINNLERKWELSTSISKRSILCDTLEYILKNSDEEIIYSSKKKGFYQTLKNYEKISYYIVVTEKANTSDLKKRCNTIKKEQINEKINKTIVIYPYQKKINDVLVKGIDIIFYDMKDVPIKLEKIFNNLNHIENVASYLQELGVKENEKY